MRERTQEGIGKELWLGDPEAGQAIRSHQSGGVVVDGGEIAAQLWAGCHLRQWGFSEMELP